LILGTYIKYTPTLVTVGNLADYVFAPNYRFIFIGRLSKRDQKDWEKPNIIKVYLDGIKGTSEDHFHQSTFEFHWGGYL
jgi:hypothetical protein